MKYQIVDNSSYYWHRYAYSFRRNMIGRCFGHGLSVVLLCGMFLFLLCAYPCWWCVALIRRRRGQKAEALRITIYFLRLNVEKPQMFFGMLDAQSFPLQSEQLLLMVPDAS